jgi:hypothetical protein
MATKETSPGKETFDEFRTSFSCGSRNDLLFKWMKTGSEELTDDFLDELLDLTGNLIDNGDTQPMLKPSFGHSRKHIRVPGTSNMTTNHLPYWISRCPRVESPCSQRQTTSPKVMIQSRSAWTA